jgi:hypothetical protein
MTLSSRVETCPNPKSVKDWSRVIVSIGRICGTLETQILLEGISPQEWYLWKRILATYGEAEPKRVVVLKLRWRNW